MSGKVKVIIGIIITAILVSGIWVFITFQRTKSITEKFEGEIAQLTATLDALGPNVTCYTVTEEYVNHYDNNTAGQIIADNSLQPIEVPSSLVGDAYITDISQIVGKYCKVNIEPGTPITGDLLMGELYDPTLRDVDVTVNSWVVGMRVGDYVDIRLTAPSGQDYVVLTHKRVQGMGDRTIKMYLTETELHLYQSALVDYYLNSSYGARIYLTKYVEPGIQEAAEIYYAPTAEVEQMMMKDPNIISRSEITALRTFRTDLDNEFNKYVDEQTTVKQQGGLIAGGRTTLSSDIQSDVRNEQQNREDGEEDTYEETDVVLNFDESEEATGETTSTEGQTTVEETQAPEEVITETEPAAEETEAPTEPETQENIEVQETSAGDTETVG